MKKIFSMIALMLMTAVGAMAQTTYTVTVKEGTEDAANWSIDPATAAEGQTVTITYNGTKKVKSVKAVKKADAIPGLFTINASGDKVYFSKGNLQAKISSYSSNVATASEWKFADNQYDKIGAAAGNNSFATDSWVDLFSWVGNSATNDTYGLITFTSNSQAYHGNVSTESLKTDWGTAASSSIGTGWRTLTKDEWTYVFNTRSTGGTVFGTAAARYTEATINTDGTGVNGIILFPDGVDIAASEVTTAGTVNGSSAWATKCTTAQWTALESKGCVFLPAAGYRNGASVSGSYGYGYYWSSTAYYTTYAYGVYFLSGSVDPANYDYRNYGYSVRLVRPVQ